MFDKDQQSTGKLQATTFEELHRELQNAVEWLESLDVRIPSTRIHTYRKNFEALLAVYRTRDENRANEKLDEFVNTLHEVHELIEIHKGFSTSGNLGFLQPRILGVSGGPTRYVDEERSRELNAAYDLIKNARGMV